MKTRPFFILASLLFFFFAVGGARSLQASAPKIHPVILVHGINGRDSDWESPQPATNPNDRTIFHWLAEDNYDMAYVTTFAYIPSQRPADGLDDANNDVSSDSYADVSLVATYLDKEIDYLYEKSGGAKVDIVAHSLGGIVAREYMRQHPGDHRIGKFIDIGTPHSGSSILGFYGSLPEAIQPGLYKAINSIAETLGGGLADPNSTSARQISSNSPFMQTLNAAASPSDVQYWLLYGDIQLQVKLKLFWFDVYSHPLLAGDLVVSRENAATIPGLGSLGGNNPPYYHTLGFESPTNLALFAKMNPGAVDFGVEVDGPIKGFAPYWHNGLLRNQELNQKVLAILNDGYIPPEPPPSVTTAAPPTQANASSAATSATVMLFDVSGSMNEADQTEISKLDAAKAAGARILDIIEAENSASQNAEIGIASFSRGAWLHSRLSADVKSARLALEDLYADGGTGMADGLRLAIDQFADKSGAKIIILLSDGVPNIGLNQNQNLDESQIRQEVLDLAAEAGGKNICVYVVGLGVPNTAGTFMGDPSIDEDLLKQIAANSGCGAYYNAQNATDLANVYVSLRHQSTGNVLLEKTGDIAQGQTVEIGTAAVSQGAEEMLFTLNWPGSRLDPTLLDPNGVVVDQNYPGASFFRTNSLASVIIQKPKAGNWILKAYGAEVPEGVLKYHAVLSSRGAIIAEPPPAAPEENGGMIIVLAALLIGGVTTYAIVNTARRARKASPHIARPGAKTATLTIVSGENAGISFPVRDNDVIGRSRTANLHISDLSVSRQHARIRFANGQWFLQDMGSSGGTYVNGARVNATVLKPGDHIRIGSTEMQFQK